MSSDYSLKKKQATPISSLYVLKALSAFLVVSCHTPFALLKDKVSFIQCLAVPLFFMISGYFIYSDDIAKSRERVKKGIVKVIKIILLVQTLYMLWLFPNHGFMIKSLDDVLSLVFLGSLFSGHLWYLTAFLETLFVFYLFFRLDKAKYLFLLLPFFLLNLLFSQYSFLLDISLPYKYFYNAVFYGLPFVTLGYLIRKREAKLLSFKHWGLIALLALALSLVEKTLILDIMHTSTSHGLFIFSGLGAFAIFLFFLSHRKMAEGTYLERIGATHSGNIYYFHIMLATILSKLFELMGNSWFYEDFGVVLTFVFSLLLSELIMRGQKLMGWHIL